MSARPAGALARLRTTAVFLALLVLLAAGPCPASAADEFLPAREAFRLKTDLEHGELAVIFDVAPGYYLYRDRFAFESATPGVTVGPPSFPVGEEHEDEFFGRQVVFRDHVVIGLKPAFNGPVTDFDLKIRLQGCADGGLCYPPQNWTTRVSVPAGAAQGAAAAASDAARALPTGPEPAGRRGGFDLKRLLGGSRPLSDSDFLPVDQAFVFSARSTAADRVELRWEIADDYYLYRDKIDVATTATDVRLGPLERPDGERQTDEYFGEQVVYYGEAVVNLPISRSPSATELPLTVSYQGCADAGLCYPPTRKQLTVRLVPGVRSGDTPPDASEAAAPNRTPGTNRTFRSEQDALAERIRSGKLLAVLATFFGAGLLLAFTPCVLPMIPILSGIIVGAGRGGQLVSRGRAFALSLAYVLGMAATYTVAGATFAAAGRQAQAFFQQPWILVLFAGLFVFLALAMFGVFNLQVPSAFQSRVSEFSNRQRQGSLPGTAVMGALSSLIVTACVAPPLVAALAVIGQSGDVLRGALALFALSIGMGAPLLVVGASAGQLLPRAGPWMDTVKAIFGLMFLGVAVWMLGRLLPGPVTLGLWAALAIGTGAYLAILAARGSRSPRAKALWRGAGALVAVYGVLLAIGALAGRDDPLRPLAGLTRDGGHGSGAPLEHVAFERIKSVADLERELAAAAAAGRPVMLDFYADWCVSCKEMERYTFPDPGVRAELERAVLLQADVTANDDVDQALLTHFGILGPPTIVFFGADGRERTDYRVVGFKRADEFRAHVAQAFGGDAG